MPRDVRRKEKEDETSFRGESGRDRAREAGTQLSGWSYVADVWY